MGKLDRAVISPKFEQSRVFPELVLFNIGERVSCSALGEGPSHLPPQRRDPVATRHSRMQVPSGSSQDILIWILHFGFRLQKARNGENNS